MNDQTPFIAAISILGIILLLSFVNGFFRKYNIIKKRKPKKRKSAPVEVFNKSALVMLKAADYSARIALVTSDAKKALDNLPPGLNPTHRQILSDEIINTCKLKISKIK